MHEAETRNGFQVLTREFAHENKALAEQELNRARRRTYTALALSGPVMLLAMLEIALP